MEENNELTKDEIKEKSAKYDQREMYWSNQSLQQLGYSMNLFLTIGLGFLGYLISQRSLYPKFDFFECGCIESRLLFYCFLLILLFSSVIFGTISIIVRLYDLRITRHITGIRKITLKKFSKTLPVEYVDLTKYNFWNSVLFKINFIHVTDDITYEIIKEKFPILRMQAKLLGRVTWFTHYVQIGLILFVTLIYGIYIVVG